jgi:protein-tyrosine phosphatase
MWHWTLNWNEIREDLLIGSCPMSGSDLDRIRHETGASAILSLQHAECLAHFGIDYEQHRVHGRRLCLEMARSPMLDFNPGEQRQRLPTAVHRLWDLITDRHRVYVHCTAGMGRSALTVLGYLTFIEGYTPDEAIRLLKSKRPCVIPSLEAYDGCREDLLNPRHDEVERQAWIAYCDRSARQQAGSAEGDWYRAENAVLRVAVSVCVA